LKGLGKAEEIRLPRNRFLHQREGNSDVVILLRTCRRSGTTIGRLNRGQCDAPHREVSSMHGAITRLTLRAIRSQERLTHFGRAGEMRFAPDASSDVELNKYQGL
jgi:hypothetical protein